MMKKLIAAVFVLVGVVLSGCANISADNDIDVGGHVSYEYQKSF
jgi:predicted small secreted protein